MYEHHSQPLLPRHLFIRRFLRHLGIGSAIMAFSLLVGVVGYHVTEDLPWLDALLNASMILGGMGPVDAVRTDGGKLFASAYALFSGVVFLATAGIIIAPAAHRLLHRLHLDEADA